MVALEQLSAEEEALWLILSDPTGCDQAEFFLLDTDSDDGCTRLWDFQWPYLHCNEPYQVDLLARLLGKSLSVAWRAMAFAVLFPGQQMLLAAPELNQLSPLTDKVGKVFDECWLFDQMRPQKGSKGIRRQPQWELTLLNGAQILSRLPKKDGTGVKSLHPVVIEGDEAQEWTVAAYNETIETLKSYLDGISWRMHGVSKGKGRDLHYALTQGHLQGAGDIRWFTHQYSAMHRPTWNDEERQRKIKQYGGDENHPDYVRNVYGLPSDAGSAIFVLSRLNATVDRDDVYNDEVYSRCKIMSEEVRSGNILEFVHIPTSHLGTDFTSYWAGLDYGYAADPTEILLFGTERKGKKDRLLLRVHMERVSMPMQAEVILHLFEVYGERLKRIGLDSTSSGSGLPQILHDPKCVPNDVATRIIGYDWGTKIPVAFDELSDEPKPEDRVIRGYAKDFGCVDAATEILTRRGWLTHDQLVDGEDVMTWDTTTNKPCWSLMETVLRYTGEIPVRRIETNSFSAITTLDHRWWVRCHDGKWRWRQTQTLGRFDGIPKPAPVSNLPASPIYSNAFIELVGWFWTEGWIARWGEGERKSVCLCQSTRANPQNIKRIETALDAMGIIAGHADKSNGVRVWRITKADSLPFWKVIDPTTKALLPDFLDHLTQEQLSLLVEVSLLADGSRKGNSWCIGQAESQEGLARLSAFQMAATLAGLPTTLTHQKGDRYHLTISSRDFTVPILAHRMGKSTVAEIEDTTVDLVWCPRTASGTWLARRNGRVYFTGNTDTLRAWVDESGIILPDDSEILGEWAGATSFVAKVAPTNDGPSRRGYGGGSLHILDAGRNFACAKALLPIDALLAAKPKQESVLAGFVGW